MTRFPVANCLSKTAFALALVSGSILLASQSLPAQTFTTLHDFTGQTDGSAPSGVLTMDRAGNLYGTASTGGGNNGCSPGPSCGIVYKLTHRGSSWLFSTIYAFHGRDGSTPQAGVVFGPDGALYGTAGGGAAGLGVVFRLQPSASICQAVSCMWTETVLHPFTGGTQDGGGTTYGPLVFDRAGNMYGTTVGGGASGVGTVYEISPSSGGWVEKVIYSFQNDPDGSQPESGLVFDNAGNLYGTTTSGGIDGGGTVFELTPNGSSWTESVLYRFPSDSPDNSPFAGVTLDAAGNVYFAGGRGGITVYELSPSGGGWTSQALYQLGALWGPYESMNFDSTGNLLGTVNQGNPEVFRLTPSSGQWTVTGFTGHDGGGSLSNAIQDAGGNIYATSSVGGANGNGTVFQITP